MSLNDLSPELAEWIYGPALDEDDEPLSVGEEYQIAEEEERFRWIPGYRELVERYLSALKAWHALWVPGEGYPPEPDDVRLLRPRVSEYQRTRAEPPSHG